MRKLMVAICLLVCSAVIAQYQETPRGIPESDVFLRGDLNNDHQVCLTDAVLLLEHLFGQRDLLCKDAADADDNGRIELTDAVQLLTYLFRGGAIAAPTSAPGVDPTDDDLCHCAYDVSGFGY